MKYIKKFENIKDEPKVGDYVLMKSSMQNKEMTDFIDNTIGKIIKIEIKYHFNTVSVEYEDIPMEIASLFGYENYNLNHNIGFREFLYSSIIDYSENKEDLEYKIKAKNFNL